MKEQKLDRRDFLKGAVVGGAAADAIKNRYMKTPGPLVQA